MDDTAGPSTADDGSAPDPATAGSAAEFATLLARLHLHRGAPSLRELERRATAAVEGRRIPLSRSTISAVLNGHRLPSHDGLLALLAALGLDDRERQPWLRARAGLVGAPTHDGQREAVDPASPVITEPRRPPRWWWIAVGLVAAGVAVAAWAGTHPVAGTLRCEPSSCVAVGPRLVVHGTVSGRPASDRQVVLMIRVEGTQRWYVGPVIAPAGGAWSSDVGVGNPVPQERDRAFTICLDLLPAGAVDGLIADMVQNAGNGLAPTDLPGDRAELACVPAQRPRGS